MAEQLTLATNEVVPQKVTTYYRLDRLLLDWRAAIIIIGLRGEQGETREFRYDGPTATTMMAQLNKANLSTKSLQARVMERLSADGLLVGVVAGTPD